jgi:hypothetical protein
MNETNMARIRRRDDALRAHVMAAEYNVIAGEIEIFERERKKRHEKPMLCFGEWNFLEEGRDDLFPLEPATDLCFIVHSGINRGVGVDFGKFLDD